MLSVVEALAAIVGETPRLRPLQLSLSDTLGLVLAAEAVCDLDSPPFDKSLMDGYAVRTADLHGAEVRLSVIDEVPAGQVSRRTVGAREAIRIMTGAPLPAGADVVVPVERTRCETNFDQQTVVIDNATAPVSPGKNILKRGESTKSGTRVVSAGSRLRSQEIGALAELGNAMVEVFPAPRVGVLATGDELVAVDQIPGPGQIRNSNESMLVAQLRQMGAIPVPLGVARDDRDDLRRKIDQGLEYDILLLSGGVSAGKFDLAPAVLAAAGVREVFHRVKIKPGQPLWFGIKSKHQGAVADQPAQACPVFGLPGNPVSSMVCCELFVRTAVRRMMGIEPAISPPMKGRLVRDHFNSGNRPTYHQAHWDWTEQGGSVEPVKWVGSADLCATAAANALAVFAEGNRHYSAGELIDVLLW